MYIATKIIKRLRVVLLGGLVSIVAAAPPLIVADDTDVYIDSISGDDGDSPVPFIMFTLDLKGNLASTECTETTRTDINEKCGYSTAIVDELSDDDLVGGINFFEILRAALKLVVDDIKQDVYMGLMVSHHDSCPVEAKGLESGPLAAPLVDDGPGCSNGGYIMSGFKLFKPKGDPACTAGTPDPDCKHQDEFFELLSNIPVPGGGAEHKFQGKELYFELFRYLTGQKVYNGKLGYTDFGTDNLKNLDEDHPLVSWDESIISGDKYISPLVGDENDCSKLAVINLMFQVSQQDHDSDGFHTEAKPATKTKPATPEERSTDGILASAENGGMFGINLAPPNNEFDSVIHYMRGTDLAPLDESDDSVGLDGEQNVRSFIFVNSRGKKGGPGADKPLGKESVKKVNDYASAGGTVAARVLSEDPDKLTKDLAGAINEILSVSATFVSASVPVNVFNKSQTLNHLFYAVFQPFDKPSWVGNVKRLRVSTDASGRLLVLDANGVDAIAFNDSGGGGKIKGDALTFWTDTDKLPGVSAAEAAAGAVDGKDGLFVERGGAGQNTPGFRDTPKAFASKSNDSTDSSARTLYFDNGAGPLAPLNVDATTANLVWAQLKSQVGSSASTFDDASDEEKADALKLLAYARGIKDGDEDAASPLPRSWLIGDLLHSRAVPVNYGNAADPDDTANPDIRLLVNSNDGFMRSIRNNKPDASLPYDSGSADGTERWAFMPRAAMDVLGALTSGGGASDHPYGIDSSPVVYTKDIDGDGNIESGKGDKVYAFFGMRRGGSAYYALDITDPDVPKLLWSKSVSDTAFSEMGLTFSTPQTGILDWDGKPAIDGRKPVLVFAGGYDTNKDLRGVAATDDGEGRAVYVVDAETGDLVWKAVGAGSASSSVPVVVVESGMVDSIPSEVALVDTTGDGKDNRFYVGDTGGVVWRGDFVGDDPSKWTIRKLASVGRHESGGDDRRFFHRPDYVRGTDGTGRFDGVLIGSGNRANPKNKDIQNRFYLFKDRDITAAPITTTLEHGELDNLTSATATTAAGGWYFDLGDPLSGEKMLSSPLTFAGEVFFSTYEPSGGSSSGVCAPTEGLSKFYVVSFTNAAAVRDFDGTDGLERSTYSGSGIGGDPLFLAIAPEDNPDGDDTTDDGVGGTFITSGNVSTRLRDPLPSQPILRTFWYERP